MASDNFSFPDKEGFFGEYGGKFVPAVSYTHLRAHET